MHVIKFGGAVLKNKKGFFCMVDILKKSEKKPVIIILSAFSKATRNLKKAAKIAETGDDNKALIKIDSIVEKYRKFSEQLIKNKEILNNLYRIFEKGKQELYNIIHGISITKELTSRTLDTVLSFGEFFALHTVHQFLIEKNFNTAAIDSTLLITSNSEYGKAKPILEDTLNNIKKILVPALKNYDIVITQGFVAKSREGEITTMGMESSNLTAALIANLLNIKELTIWTDVEGFRTADPLFVPNTKSIAGLNYSDAFLAASNGLKLIYPTMTEYLKKSKIKLTFRSAFCPNGDSTTISEDKNKNEYPIIILLRSQKLVKVNFYPPLNEAKKFDFLSKITPNCNDILFYQFSQDSIFLVIPDYIKFEQKLENKIEKTIYKNISIITILNAKQHYLESILKIIQECSEDVLKLINDFEKKTGIIKIIVNDKHSHYLTREIHKRLLS